MTTVTPEHTPPPVQPAPVLTSPVASPVGAQVDHVHSHGPRCFWDFRDCRWDCSRP